ncbi:glycosyltransferase [Proteiniclasticum ruminis]|uniref:glycosyltransferase n=1 Tax=Proteiniclasticum ruminis TaxID=398199 RepID=UPI0028AD94BE|nr:glycosyltransferase [Proteiniclasticum ruminis]
MIKKNDLLSIAIPTYKRHEILYENLCTMIPYLEKYSIAVYISDDSTDDNTLKALTPLFERYPLILYSKNEKNLGHDRNCIKTLSLPDTEYIWYLGDSQIIEQKYFSNVLDNLDKYNPDFYVVNAKERCNPIPSKIYSNKEEFFVDLSWHATLTGATIYRRTSIDLSEARKFIGSNFIQLGILLESNSFGIRSLFWDDRPLIYMNQNKRDSYWTKSVFNVFAKDWCVFVLSLSNYTYDDKLKVIKSHSVHTGIFAYHQLKAYRKEKVLTLITYMKYRKYLKYCTSVPLWVMFFVSIMPTVLIKVEG